MAAFEFPLAAWLAGFASAYPQPTATIVAATLAAMVATYGIRSSVRVANYRETLTFLSKFDIEPELDAIAKSAGEDYISAIDRLLFGNKPYDEMTPDERKILHRDFYKYELLALGIQRKALSEDICYDYLCTYLLQYRRFMGKIVDPVREQTGVRSMFAAAEWLMIRWEHRSVRERVIFEHD